MKVIANYDENPHPPLLSLYVHWAPHERSHHRILEVYRRVVYEAIEKVYPGQLPIDHQVDLKVLFVDPTSPDLDHLLVALYMALDGKSKRPGWHEAPMTNDDYIFSASMGKMFNEVRDPPKEKRLVIPRYPWSRAMANT